MAQANGEGALVLRLECAQKRAEDAWPTVCHTARLARYGAGLDLGVAGARCDGRQQAVGRRVVADQDKQRALVAAAQPEPPVRGQVRDVEPALPSDSSPLAPHHDKQTHSHTLAHVLMSTLLHTEARTLPQLA